LADGTIDILASGHDPRGPEDKRLPFADAAPGMAGAETLLSSGLGFVRDGLISLPRLFDLLSAAPARLLGVTAGAVQMGLEADLILVNPDTPWQVDARRMPGLAGNTPFDGLPMQGRVTAVWKGGNRVA
jgi:dihydroorotase